MRCEMCGSEKELVYALIEGAKLLVCRDCSSYGRVVGKPKPPEPARILKKRSEPKAKEEPLLLIKKDYPSLIKRKRESSGLKQGELAKLVGVKESVIHQYETGHLEPDLEVTRRLEKALRIKLVEEYGDEPSIPTKKGLGSLTIGDVVKVR